ncbi:putative RNA-directed DNA polymerase [Helianthus annuus]|nr:putative RNA-directed DNA polymerase [Helianthus annuus]
MGLAIGVVLGTSRHNARTVTPQQLVQTNSLHKPVLLIIAHKHLLHGCRTLVQVAMWRPISMALMNLNLTTDTLTRTILLMGPSKNGLYSFNLPKLLPVSNVTFSTVRASPTTWHQRLGHPHTQLLKSMISNNDLPVINNSVLSYCNSCPMGKSTKTHLTSSPHRSTHALDLIFCDVWGPAPINSFYGHRYFLLCVDHYTRYMWLFPIQHKSDVSHIFKQFHTMAERQFQSKIKSVQIDRVGEFRSLSSFFTTLGICTVILVPIQANKMVLLKDGTDMSSKPVSLSWPNPVFQSIFGTLPLRSQHIS